MSNVTPLVATVLAIELIPAAAFGFAGERMSRTIAKWPAWLRFSIPALCAVPYAILSVSAHQFRWAWLTLYLLLPVAMAWLLAQAALADPQQRGNWRDALILLTLGLAVDLRWFDAAWPSGLRGLGNLVLVDAGLYAFLGTRRLSGTGFDFHLRWSDWKVGLRELAFFAPFVLAGGLALGFLHPHVPTSSWKCTTTTMPTCLQSAKPSLRGSVFLSLSPYRKSFSFAPGYKIFLNAESGVLQPC